MTTRQNATLYSRQTLYEGRVFTFHLDRVRLPSGYEKTMEVIRHPGSVVIVAQPTPGEIILVRQYRYTLDRWIWELPAGSLEPDETFDQAAARECEEEIGLVPGHVERLRGFYPTPGFCDEEMIFYRCTGLRPPAPNSTAHRDADEDLEPRTFTLDDAAALLRSGEIVDLKTAVGLTFLAAL
jgi:8-oxo-dGTP pyrophosphatase MutT (NUDIX family)